jgi:nucleoid-associated protein YgaU
MVGRSPARFLAPVALLAFCVALYLVVSGPTGHSADRGAQGSEARPAGERQAGERTRRTRTSRGTRRYTVRPGDTLSTIAERFGVTTAEIEDLNPALDPQLLSPGQRLRVRR